MKTEMLGPLEQKIMNVLWCSDKPLKTAQVLKYLKKDYAYTTIMTVLKRMVDKNLLKRNLKAKAYYYYPLVNKDHFVQDNLSVIYDNLVTSYGKLAISQFVDTVKTDKESLSLLKEYLSKNR